MPTYTENSVNYSYVVGSGIASVARSASATGNPTILSSFVIDGSTYNVTSIESNAFSGTSITSITIPASVTSIGNFGFQACQSMTSVVFAENSALTTIGSNVFEVCILLNNFTVPASVTSIGNNTLSGCSSLTNITLKAPISNLGDVAFNLRNPNMQYTLDYAGTIPNGMFYGHNSLTVVNIGASITSIEYQAFQHCSALTTINFLSSSCALTSIGQNAFYQCTNLTAIAIPNQVTSIGIQCFWGCTSLATLTFSPTSSISTIGTNAFSNCSSLTSLTIPASMTSFGGGAFHGCTNLRTIVSNSTVSFASVITQTTGLTITLDYAGVISSSAFASMTTLTSVTIGPNITSIETSAFQSCTALTTVSCTSSSGALTTIGNNAFYGCTALSSINISDLVTSIGTSAFQLCSALSTVTFTSSSTLATINGNAFNQCTSLVSINIPDSVTSIGDSAFQGCTALTTVGFTSSSALTTIGTNTFNSCSNLNNFTFPSNVTSVGNYSLSGCSSLTNITFKAPITSFGLVMFNQPNTGFNFTVDYSGNIVDAMFNGFSTLATINIGPLITGIGSQAFQNCLALTTINYLSSSTALTSIGQSAFQSCKALTTVTIPNSVTIIDASAFNNCILLETVNMGSSVTTIGVNAFYNCLKILSINIPNTVTTISDQAFWGCKAMTSLTFSSNSSLTSIGVRSFSWCTLLTNIVLPNSLTSIASLAFNNCQGLQTITLPNAVTTLPTYLFNYCISLTTAAIPSSVTTISEGAFHMCSNLTSITIPSSVTTIGDYAFKGCSNATSLTFTPTSSVTSIGVSAFESCNKLPSVTIPASVSTISANAFANCILVTSFTVDANNPYYSSDSNGTLFDETITSLVAYPSASTTTEYTIPSTVSSISSNAFFGCTSLASVIIPASITTIGDNVFNSCNALLTVRFLGEIPTIGNNNFTVTNDTAVYTVNSTINTNSSTVSSKLSMFTNFVQTSTVSQVGILNLSNKSLSDGSFTITDPTKPSDNTGTWSYTTADTDKITISGNTVTLVSTGIARIVATLSSDSNYSSVTIIGQFSISDAGTAPSTFAFTSASAVTTVVPPSIAPVAGVVSLSLELFSASDLTQFNPSSGTDIEKAENRNMVVDTLFSMFPTASALTIPPTAIYLPSAIDLSGVAVVKVFKTFGSTSENPVVIDSSVIDQNTVFFSEFDEIGNAVLMNGINTFSGYSVKIVKQSTSSYNIFKTDNQNVTTTSSAVEGDTIAYAGYRFVIGSITGQLADPRPVITNFSVPAKAYGDAPFTIVDPSSNSNGSFSYTSSDTSIATVSGNVITIVGIGSSTITATQASTNIYDSGSVTSTLVVSKTNTVLSDFSIPAKTYGDAAFTITAPTTNSSGSITYTTSDITVATVADNTITVVGVGSATITATQAETSTYTSATITATLVVNKIAPTISDFSIPTKTFGNSAFAITVPLSNSSGSFSYSSSNTAVATIVGNVISIVGAGTSTITATQATTSIYSSGTITAEFVVNKITPTLSNFSVASRAVGSSAFALTAPTSTSNGAFTYTSSNTAVATISGPNVTIVGAGSTTITATQASTATYESGTITAVFQTYTTGTYTLNNVNYVYNVGLGTAKIASSTSATGDITLVSPFIVNDVSYNVTSIDAYAFQNRPITSINIPNTVTTIGTNAFWATNISSITIPASVTSIANNAFGNCGNLATYVINAYISNLGSVFTFFNASLQQTWTFDYVGPIPDNVCLNRPLNSVTMSNSITGIGGSAFKGCTGLTGISLPPAITYIGGRAFQDCAWITSITIPNTVTVIGVSCFQSTGLTSFTLPSDMSLNPTYGVYGQNVFNGCTNLTSVNIFSYVPFLGEMLNGFATSNITLTMNYVGTIPSIAFQNKTFIKTVNIGNLITSIGGGAFYQSSNLTNISLGTSLTTIEGNAFYGCSKITTINLPSSLVTIEGGVFAGTGISSITIPPSVTTIGGDAFNGCIFLSSLTIPSNVISVGDNLTKNCTSLRNLVIQSSSILSRFIYSFNHPDNSNSSIIFDCSGSIPSNACLNRTLLTSVTIGNNITSISAGAFELTGIAAITIPPNVLTIANSAFARCSSLTNIVVKRNYSNFSSIFTNTNVANTRVTFDYAGSIPASACTNKTGITEINISNSITGIGNSAFSGCTGLTEIVIPASVTTIGTSSFNGCTNLNSVAFLGQLPTIGATNFTSLTDTAFYMVDDNININPAAVTTSLSMFTTKTIVGIVSPIVTNFPDITVTYGNAPFTLNDPSSNSNGMFVYTSSNTAVATIIGSIVTMVGPGTAIITATQQTGFSNGTNYTQGLITATLVVNKQTPTFGSLDLTNKSLADVSFSIVNPTQPSDHNGTWSYSIKETTRATVSGNVVTLLATGIVTVTATLTGTAVYNAISISKSFSISAPDVAPSTFTFTPPTEVAAAIPITIAPVANAVTLPPEIFTPEKLTAFNPPEGTPEEKSANRNALVQTLFTLFTEVKTISLPVTAIYLPPTIDVSGVSDVKLISGAGTSAAAPFIMDTTTISASTAFYCAVDEVGNAVEFTGAGEYTGFTIKVVKISDTKYSTIRTNDQNVTTTRNVYQGDIVYYAGLKLVIGSIVGQFGEPPPSSNICFPAGTLITTNQGAIPIEKIDSNEHTIRGKKIVGVTETISDDKYLVCFEKHALAHNVPSMRTVVTKQHMVFHNGKMTPAGLLVNYASIHKIRYTGEPLYNVLLEQEDKMMVNNMICETLHPEHPIAQLYMYLKQCNSKHHRKLIKMYNDNKAKKTSRAHL